MIKGIADKNVVISFFLCFSCNMFYEGFLINRRNRNRFIIDDATHIFAPWHESGMR